MNGTSAVGDHKERGDADAGPDRHNDVPAWGRTASAMCPLVDSLTDWVWEMDMTGVHTYSNPAVESLLGYTPDEVVGRHTSDLWVERSRNPDSLDRLGRELASGQGWRDRVCRFGHKDGSVRVLESTGIPVFDGKGRLRGYRGMDRDITRWYRDRRSLIEERNRAELYLDILSHDINNLNQAVIAYHEMMMLKGGMSEEHMRFLEKSLDQAHAVSGLISNVRKLTELRQGEFHLGDVDIADVLEGAVERLHMNHPERDIVVDCSVGPGPMRVRGNELLLDVFLNILENAVKFDRHDDVRIEVSVEPRAPDGTVRVEFSDNGPGIPDDMKDKVFRRFSRGDRSVDGSGLGLTIVKEIVENCGGSVRALDRVPGEHAGGARLVILLPSAN